MAGRYKFRRVNEITGTFVLVIVALLIGAIVWTSRSQRWFRSNVTLRIVLPEDGAAGIREGSEVYFLGTRVGTVSYVIVDEAGRMEARTNIRRDFFKFVRADSTAVVKKKFGVAGDSFFEITRGKGKSLPERDASIVCNEQIQSALEYAIEEIRNEAAIISKKASAGLDAWTQLSVDLGETRRHLDRLTDRVDEIASAIQAGKGLVGRLLNDSALADDARILLTRANDAATGLQGIITNLDYAAKDIQTGAARLPEIAGVVASESKDLPGLVQQTQASMRELERLIEAMQRHWLLRKYVNYTNPPPVHPLPGTAPGESKPARTRFR